jgi:hypothetical protein
MKEALEIIRMSKPSVDPNIGFVGQLLHLEEQVAASKEEETESAIKDSEYKILENL